MGLLDGGMETLILVALVAFLFLGTDQLPQLARSVGQLQARWKMHQRDFNRQMRQAMQTTHDRTDDDALARQKDLVATGDLTVVDGHPRPRAVREGSEGESQAAMTRPPPAHLVSTAAALGIDPSGKDEEQLRLLVKEAL